MSYIIEFKSGFPFIVKGQPPEGAEDIRAPIRERGFIIRFIGRFLMEESPSKTVSNSWAAKTPDSNRAVVPELPTLITPSGFFNPFVPFP